MFTKKYSVEALDITVDLSKVPTFNEAKVVHIDGKGALRDKTRRFRDDILTRYYDVCNHTEIMLNDIPLMQIGVTPCPTCAQILATGYGISNASCKELNEISEKINAPFVSLDAAIDVIRPLLALLESGLYIVADAICFPTDGNGNFFWNVPNEPTENMATVPIPIWSPKMEYNTYVFVPPVYLYPTQSTDCYNENRVKHYIDMFKTMENQPRAIAYNFWQSVSFVIDGHHKACAASILGRPLNCIVILPFLAYNQIRQGDEYVPVSLVFSTDFLEIPIEDVPIKRRPRRASGWEIKSDDKDKGISECIPTGTIIKREWEKEYLDSAKNYLYAHEYALAEHAKVPYGDRLITDDMIEDCFNCISSRKSRYDEVEENCLKLAAILYVLKCDNKPRMKKVALKFAEYCKGMMSQRRVMSQCIYDSAEQTYKLLSEIKDDDDIEQLFIDYIVECEDKTDPILNMVHRYWD